MHDKTVLIMIKTLMSTKTSVGYVMSHATLEKPLEGLQTESGFRKPEAQSRVALQHKHNVVSYR